jgi:hypothetical protein
MLHACVQTRVHACAHICFYLHTDMACFVNLTKPYWNPLQRNTVTQSLPILELTLIAELKKFNTINTKAC